MITAPAFNTLIISGTIIGNPVIRRPLHKKPVARFAISLSGVGGNNGFLKVFAEDNLAEFVATFLKEGVLARIYGRLVVQERLTRNGDNRHVIELQARQIVVLREPQVESTDDAPGTASLKLLSPKEEECSPL